MKIYRIIFLIIICIAWLGSGMYFDCKRESDINKMCLENLNLRLTGVIDTIDYVHGGYDHGYGMIRLRILNSNMREYIPPYGQRYYFCIIKNGMAEIYESPGSLVKGDTITINTPKKSMLFKRMNGEKYSSGIAMFPEDGFYDYVTTHHLVKP